jgi:hypothetical protein
MPAAYLLDICYHRQHETPTIRQEEPWNEYV